MSLTEWVWLLNELIIATLNIDWKLSSRRTSSRILKSVGFRAQEIVFSSRLIDVIRIDRHYIRQETGLA